VPFKVLVKRPKKSREWLRCPCCGKISRGPAFGLGGTGKHVLQVLTQSFIGGRGHGFRWERRPCTQDELEGLHRTVELVRDRLRRELSLPDERERSLAVERLLMAERKLTAELRERLLMAERLLKEERPLPNWYLLKGAGHVERKITNERKLEPLERKVRVTREDVRAG
jgi:hypothetical protein